MIVVCREPVLLKQCQGGNTYGSIEFAHGLPPLTLIFFHQARMSLVGEIGKDRTDWLQAVETRDVVRVQFVPLIQQPSIVFARDGQNHEEFCLFDLRRQRPIAILLSEKHLGSKPAVI